MPETFLKDWIIVRHLDRAIKVGTGEDHLFPVHLSFLSERIISRFTLSAPKDPHEIGPLHFFETVFQRRNYISYFSWLNN